jgi:hypothetical protein
MSDASIVPERQLVFSPGLAATIGLEEAILLQHLQALFAHREAQRRDNFAWVRVERDYLQQSLPFWGPPDLHRITRSLVDKGVILMESPPLHSADYLLFALNEPLQRRAATPARPEAAPPRRRSAGLLPAQWMPSEDLLQLLALNHNIPRQFAIEQVEDFVFYWRERAETSHAWENKFRQHVTGAWRRHQQQQGQSFRVPEAGALDRDWRPSPDALEILQRSDIDLDFIEQAIPEFILYWRERGAPPKELNSKFIQHIRVQWARFSSSLAHDHTPRPIAANWTPSEDVYDILRLCHIELDFAEGLLPEFIVYWRDRGQAQTSWNSKFLQHVKYHWAKRHQFNQAGQQHGGHPGSDTAGRTRDRSLQDDLTDTSWAE